MGRKRYIVSVSADAGKVSEIAKRLKQGGLTIDQELEAAGTITGSAEESMIEGLRKVRGVEHIEEEGGYQLPPPESDVM